VIVSHRLRCIFVHVQKTAGTSIENVLRHHDADAGSNLHAGRRHLHAREIRELVPRDVWDGYFKFAFVRNPFERLVSWYFMCVQVPVPNGFCRYVRDNFPTFESFVTGATSGMGEKTTRNQADYVNDADGAQIVDFVGRYESLTDDFAKVARRLGVAAALPRSNPSTHGDYRDYYTDAMRDIVAARYARDLDCFGYRF
jgi:hypothetical protein